LEATERGRQIAHAGIPSQKIASCVDCHSAGGRLRKEEYPVLAGQPADYIVLQLELFKEGKRGGSAYAHLMQKVAPRLTAEQMRDVALYFESVALDAR
jgi:cytochrome c553